MSETASALSAFAGHEMAIACFEMAKLATSRLFEPLGGTFSGLHLRHR
jgi:hypothetical protein